MVKLLFGVFAVVFLVLALMALALSTSLIGGGTPSPQAQQDIPPQLLPVYQTAADSCPGLPWSVLAAIGKVETDHGRSTAPGVRSGANFAGAAGPMQIGIGGKAGNTFAGYAIDADGGGASVYSPVDAIFTAANYLCQNGAGRGADVAGAIFAYNHADWYVTKVLAIASTYAASQGLPPGAPAEEVAAAEQLDATVANMRFIKPLDDELVFGAVGVGGDAAGGDVEDRLVQQGNRVAVQHGLDLPH